MIKVRKVIEFYFDGDYVEAEENTWVNLIVEDGSSVCGDIVEIKEDSLILNEDVSSCDGIEVSFDEIVGLF